MRMLAVYCISALFHLLVILSLSLFAQAMGARANDLTYIELHDVDLQKPVVRVVKKTSVAHSDLSDNKSAVQTNTIPDTNRNDDDEDTAGADNGPTNYFPFHLAEEIPVALTAIEPAYPEEARRLGIEGRVTVLIYIDAAGKVRKVEVLKSPDGALSKAAVDAIMKTEFKPARINGAAQPVVMQFTIRFRLQ